MEPTPSARQFTLDMVRNIGTHVFVSRPCVSPVANKPPAKARAQASAVGTTKALVQSNPYVPAPASVLIAKQSLKLRASRGRPGTRGSTSALDRRGINSAKPTYLYSAGFSPVTPVITRDQSGLLSQRHALSGRLPPRPHLKRLRTPIVVGSVDITIGELLDGCKHD